ncbi:nucleoside hydrolase [Streptomyces netropsis]|uniref:nucleoside hydrolase n=1 Tax=Streptomyces netropsis TaxID=55404 RepID=UPI003790CAAF
MNQAVGRRVVLDGDYGIDDALALLYLVGTGATEICAVGTVHGNTGAVQAAHNALHLLDLAGLPGVPVAVGAHRPLAQAVEYSSLVHGDDGMGGQAVRPAPERRPVPESAAEQLVRIARAHPGECSVLATGPLTNLALALQLEPELPRLVSRVVVMGGAVVEPGNVTPLGEANIVHDPEAADLVLSADWPLTLVTVDATMRTWLEPSDLARLEAVTSPAGVFVRDALRHYVRFYGEHYDRRGCPLHDPTAAVVLVDPTAATEVLTRPVRVELRGEHTRGTTVVDRRDNRGPGRPEDTAVRLVLGVDRDRVVREVLDGVLAVVS